MAEIASSLGEFQALVQPLIGLPVAEPWKGYGSAIFLELGQLASLEPNRRRANGEACISVEWDWRVEGGASILYGSSNRRPKIVRGIETLLGATIQIVEFCGDLPELIVRFSNGHCLRSMAMVTGDPQWCIRLADEKRLYVKAGALIIGDGSGSDSTDDGEEEVFALAEKSAKRWGVPRAEPAPGRCMDCASYVPLDGEGHLLDYGACIASASPFDGRAVNCNSGCPAFTGR